MCHTGQSPTALPGSLGVCRPGKVAYFQAPRVTNRAPPYLCNGERSPSHAEQTMGCRVEPPHHPPRTAEMLMPSKIGPDPIGDDHPDRILMLWAKLPREK